MWCLDVTSCKRFGLSLAFTSLHWSWAPLLWNQAQCKNTAAACRITSSDPNAAYGTRIFLKSARAALGLTKLEVVRCEIATLFKTKQLVSCMFCRIAVKCISSLATKKLAAWIFRGQFCKSGRFVRFSSCCASQSCFECRDGWSGPVICLFLWQLCTKWGRACKADLFKKRLASICLVRSSGVSWCGK